MPEFTGERLVPGEVDKDLWNEHIARYAFATPLCAGKRVLDAGCGTGYGSALLASRASEVIGVDLSPDAVEFAVANYGKAATQFLVGECAALPLRKASIERLVAFEVIEHLGEWRRFLIECERVLSPSGILFVSTPNKQLYSESRGLAGPNPFHVHEFEYEEFRDELRRLFADVRIFGQNHGEGITFSTPDNRTAEAYFETSRALPQTAGFLMAVCGKSPLSPTPNFVYVPEAGNLLSERARHIQLLSDEVQSKERTIGEIQKEHSQLVADFRALQGELEGSNRWAESLNTELAHKRARIDELQNELTEAQQQAMQELERRASEHRDQMLAWQNRAEELEHAFDERTEWARHLDAELNRQVSELARCVTLLQTAESTVVERTSWAQRAQAEADRAQAEIEELRTKLMGYETSRWVRAGRALHVGPLSK